MMMLSILQRRGMQVRALGVFGVIVNAKAGIKMVRCSTESGRSECDNIHVAELSSSYTRYLFVGNFKYPRNH